MKDENREQRTGMNAEVRTQNEKLVTENCKLITNISAMKNTIAPKLIQLTIIFACCFAGTPADARTTLKSICRLKGQEENTLQGLGIVVGLKGTGDGSSFLPTLRSLEKVMKVMGEPLGARAWTKSKTPKTWPW